jgi:hypothetical protein
MSILELIAILVIFGLLLVAYVNIFCYDLCCTGWKWMCKLRFRRRSVEKESVDIDNEMQ